MVEKRPRSKWNTEDLFKSNGGYKSYIYGFQAILASTGKYDPHILLYPVNFIPAELKIIACQILWSKKYKKSD